MGVTRVIAIVTALIMFAASCGSGLLTGANDATGKAAPDAAATIPWTQVETAVPPAGVDAQVWNDLRAELVRVLAQRSLSQVGGPALKQTSAPPYGEASVAVLSYSIQHSTLNWGYYSQGDYDQNGEVNIADLTPLGQHFGETGPFFSYSIQSVIDGDGNGEINIGDVTPLGLNFGNRVTGYHVYQASDLGAYPDAPDQPNGLGAQLVGTLNLALGSAAAGRRQYSTQVVPTPYKQWFWVRPFDGSQDGTPSNNVAVIEPDNLLPVALISAVPPTPALAHIVWSASPSHDTDGAVVRYEWDFDGDGIFEFDAGANASAGFYYYAPGLYGATVRVTDNDGANSTAQGSVEVTSGAAWNETVAFPEDSAYGSQPVSLLQVDGKPAVMCLAIVNDVNPDPTRGDMLWCRALDTFGAAWAEPMSIVQHTSGSDVFGTGAVIGNRPVCAYSDSGDPLNPKLYYLRANDALGESWGAPRLIGQPPDTNSVMPRQLLIVDGKPALVGGFNSTFYVAAENLSGTAWGDVISLPYVNLDYSQPSVASVGGLASMIHPLNDQDLLYERAAQPDGAAWSANMLVDALETVANGAKLIEVSGLPAVFYYDEVMGALKYRRARNVEGSEWEPPRVLDSRSESYVVPFVADGRPCMIYADRISDELKFMAANDASGSHWGFPIVIYESWDSFISGSRLSVISGAEIGGQPAFAFRRSRDASSPPQQPVELIAYVAYY